MDTNNDIEQTLEINTSREEQQIRQSITRYLAQREHGFNEIIFKLTQKGYSELICRTILSAYRDQDWQSDSRFAMQLIKRRIDRGYGFQYIIRECRSKGIESVVIDQILSDLDVDWMELVKNVAIRKFGDTQPKDQKNYIKRCNFLSNRGFDINEIMKVYPANWY